MVGGGGERSQASLGLRPRVWSQPSLSVDQHLWLCAGFWNRPYVVNKASAPNSHRQAYVPFFSFSFFIFHKLRKTFFFISLGVKKGKIFVNCPVVAPAFCFLYFCCLARHRGGDTVTCSLSFSLSVSLLSTSFVFRRVSSRHGLGDMLVHRPAPPICYPRRSLGAVIYAARRPHRTDPSSAWQSCR